MAAATQRLASTCVAAAIHFGMTKRVMDDAGNVADISLPFSGWSGNTTMALKLVLLYR